MRLFQSVCESCGECSYIFPDQIAEIKKNDNLKLYPYCKGKLTTGSKWFCIKCDASKKDGTRCKLIEMPSEKARKLLKIRERETTCKNAGIILPDLY